MIWWLLLAPIGALFWFLLWREGRKAAAGAPSALPPRSSEGKAGRNKSGLVLLALAGLAVWWVFFRQAGFADGDIENIRTDIRAKFEGRGVTVREVVMMRRASDPTRATGYVRLEAGASGLEISRNCEAELGDSGRLIWHCE